jgi:hypothetical protein
VNYKPSEWKIWSDIDKATVDRSLPTMTDPERIMLLQVLREPMGQAVLGQFAKEINKIDLLMCWISIEEYKQLTTDEQRRDSAMMIFKKYILRNLFSHVSEPETDSTRPATSTPNVMSTTNLVEAMAFMNAGLEEHSFAQVMTYVSYVICMRV